MLQRCGCLTLSHPLGSYLYGSHSSSGREYLKECPPVSGGSSSKQASDAGAYLQIFPTRQDGKAMLPLPAEFPVVVRDAGNCSPRNMRLTLNCIPSSAEMVSLSGMPLAVLVQPLAPPQPGEEPIQVSPPIQRTATTLHAA